MYKILSFLVIIALAFSGACQKQKEPEKKETAKKVSSGYVINFKPNDSLDLVPPQTVILQPSPAEGGNNFCVDVVAKETVPVFQASFDLTFDPAMMNYQSFKPGKLLEQKGTPDYKIAPKGDQKGKLEAKISSAQGDGGVRGTGKLVTLCFKALQPGRGDILFENGELTGPQKKKVEGVTWVGGLLWVLEAG